MSRESAPTDHKTITVVDHPVLQHKLSHMRRRVEEVHSRTFSQLMREAGMILATEATRDKGYLKLISKPINAEGTDARTDSEFLIIKPVIVPILRSGLTMAEGVREILPTPFVGHIGILNPGEREEAVTYFVSMPDVAKSIIVDGIAERRKRKIFLVDPVIVTGKTAIAAVSVLTKKPYRIHENDIYFLTLIVGDQGKVAIEKTYPGIHVYTAVEGEKVQDDDLYPGLGVVSNRLFRTA